MDGRGAGWYLSLMAPNTKGPKYAWLDPSAIYRDAQAFRDSALDLLKPFNAEEIDMIAGPEAMGFNLGSYMAALLNKGFLPLCKGGHLGVDVDSIDFMDYCKVKKVLEVRRHPFPPGTRVLIVDQWIETGGTMSAAAQLIERNQGIVAGVAAICMEEQKAGNSLKEKYTWSSCCPSDIQAQVNNQYMDSFKTYVPKMGKISEIKTDCIPYVNDKPGWYLSLAAPSTKPPQWWDLSALYRHAKALSDCVTDMLKPYSDDKIDMVAAPENMGFILGAYIAARLGKGFIPLRTPGHLCVSTEETDYTDCSSARRGLEIRSHPFPPGTRVLLVDQYIETVHTIEAAVKLIEDVQGVVAGIACIAMEDSDSCSVLKSKYKWSSCTPDHLQTQVNNHSLDSFKTYKEQMDVL